MIVIDACVTMAWCFNDEATEKSESVLDTVRAEGAWVPALWRLEVANVLRQAERRSRISLSDSSRRLELLAALPVSVDTETNKHAFGAILNLARDCTLTVYDAAYLELAIRLGLPLASSDKMLLAAARKCGVKVVDC